MKPLIFKLFTILASTFVIFPVFASGGVGLSTTRLVYSSTSGEEKVDVVNTSAVNAFLIQSWITDSQGKKSNDFILTPPLFVLKPNDEGTLRISWTEIRTLPGDRETLYYLSSKAIPSTSKGASENKNTLQIATQNNIKLFFRPASLSIKRQEATGMLTCQSNGGVIKIHNASPYYLTLVNLKLAGHTLKDTMVPPFSDNSENISGDFKGKLTFQTIDDFGAMTPRQSCG